MSNKNVKKLINLTKTIAKCFQQVYNVNKTDAVLLSFTITRMESMEVNNDVYCS